MEDVSEFKNRGSGNFSLAKEKNFFTVIGTNGLICVEKRGNGDSAGSSKGRNGAPFISETVKEKVMLKIDIQM